MLTVDKLYDNYLNIHTLIDENEDLPEREIFANYVPTSYYFLEKVFSYFPFHSQDHIVDFGCGKGRVLFMAAHNLCKYVTGYEINDVRRKVLFNNIQSYQSKFGEKTVFNIYSDVQDMRLDDLRDANKFFFFSPFHLKIYMKVLNNLLNSMNRSSNISLYLYKPYKNVIEYLDSFNFLHKEAFVEYAFISPNNCITGVPQFAIYSNYDMGHSLNEYSISL